MGLTTFINRDKEYVVNNIISRSGTWLDGGYTVCLDHVLKDDILWTVIAKYNASDEETQRWISCYVLESTPSGFGYRDYGEEENPYHYDCPVRFFDMVPVGNEEWRKFVRENAQTEEDNVVNTSEKNVGEVKPNDKPVLGAPWLSSARQIRQITLKDTPDISTLNRKIDCATELIGVKPSIYMSGKYGDGNQVFEFYNEHVVNIDDTYITTESNAKVKLEADCNCSEFSKSLRSIVLIFDIDEMP
jgi:hypothetical protein